MALKGTLKDFGIADILQLIGQQQKTGTLYLHGGPQEVHVGFRDGSIVRVESLTRKRKELIGNLLVRAELITETQLTAALATQQRTLKRLGDVLVASSALTAERFQHMVQLQATETLYKLFTWKAGTYEFKQEKVEPDPDAMTPLRAESVLMEGFRMVDEWPVIRKQISRPDMTFERLRVLPELEDEAASAAPSTPSDDPFDVALAQATGESRGSEFKSIGPSERRVFEELAHGRDLRRLIDICCLGEFETCKALLNLVNLGYVRPLYPEGRLPRPESEPLLSRLGGVVGRVAATMLLLAGVGFLVSRLPLEGLQAGGASASSFSDPAAQRFISRAQQARIASALEVLRVEKGELPESLDALVDAGLLQAGDLRHPWRERYHYRRLSAREFVLLPPLR
ncbi:DUF4388 domain-containing protein [Myxococcaceae bacterium GXIMD 01537]